MPGVLLAEILRRGSKCQLARAGRGFHPLGSAKRRRLFRLSIVDSVVDCVAVAPMTHDTASYKRSADAEEQSVALQTVGCPTLTTWSMWTWVPSKQIPSNCSDILVNESKTVNVGKTRPN